MQKDQSSVIPWYKQFWPWFLIALPAAIIIACSVTIYLAVVNPLQMVKPDYYKEGLTINKNFQQQKLARALGLSATINFDQRLRALVVDLSGDVEIDTLTELTVYFGHPLQSDLDREFFLELVPLKSSHYQIVMSPEDWQLLMQAKRWYVEISPNSREGSRDVESWKMKGEIDLHHSSTLVLKTLND